MSEPWTRFLGGEGGKAIAEDAARCVLVLADLSAKAGDRGVAARRVDRDDLEALLASLAPRLDLGLDEVGPLAFESWEDFTPLGIAARSQPLRALRQARDGPRGDPGELRSLLGEGALRGREASLQPAGSQPADGAALLDVLLGEPAAEPQPEPRPDRPRPRGDAALERVIREIAERAPRPAASGVEPETRTRIEAELARRLRSVLAHPAFRELEASWAALRRLVRQIDTGEQLRVRVVDVARPDLPAAAARLAGGLPEGERAAVVAACFAFTAAPEDHAALGALARAAESLGAIAFADAAPSVLAQAGAGALARDPSWRELEPALRARLWLVGPRVLARAPYGPDAEGAEGLGLDAADLETACWQSAAALAAEARVAATPRLEWLPVFSVARAGDADHVGPTETRLSEREVENAVAAGLVVLSAARGEDAAVVRGMPKG
jgi:hypothetical protein